MALPLTEEQQTLAREGLALVLRRARQRAWDVRHALRERGYETVVADLEDVGIDALVCAARTWRGENGCSFGSYLYRVFETRVVDYVRAECGQIRYQVEDVDVESRQPEWQPEDAVERLVLEDAIRTLPGQWRRALEAHLAGEKGEDAARRLDMKHVYYRQCCTWARQRLRQVLEDGEVLRNVQRPGPNAPGQVPRKLAEKPTAKKQPLWLCAAHAAKRQAVFLSGAPLEARQALFREVVQCPACQHETFEVAHPEPEPELEQGITV